MEIEVYCDHENNDNSKAADSDNAQVSMFAAIHDAKTTSANLNGRLWRDFAR